MANKLHNHSDMAEPHGQNHLQQTQHASLEPAGFSELVMTALAENARRASYTRLRPMTKDDFDLLLNRARPA